MNKFVVIHSNVLCPWCHRVFAVEQTIFTKWRSRITYCTFCGKDLRVKDEEMTELGYELDKQKEDGE